MSTGKLNNQGKLDPSYQAQVWGHWSGCTCNWFF